MTSLIPQFKSARRAGVPLVAIATPDPAATIDGIGAALPPDVPMLVWDAVEGTRPCPREKESIDVAIDAIGKIFGELDPSIVLNPAEVLRLMRRAPGNVILEEAKNGKPAVIRQGTVFFLHLANRWLVEPTVVQAIWNLRDAFKQDRRTLVLLGPSIELPAELAGDVVVFDEPLPGPDELKSIILERYAESKLTLKEKERVTILPRAVEAVQGLPAFQAEQVVAMSLTKEGLDVANLWERKRQQIELTPGLKVHREQVTFTDIGGVGQIKKFLASILSGKSSPAAVVFIDEIEKFIAGASGNGADSSGVSQDQLGTLLAYMQDHAATGCIFVGPPGSAKSMVAKATGTEGGIPTIQLDLGAMKGSLVGQSEQNLRAALKVITSVSNGRSLWIATCNSIGDLPPELRRRFTLGTFFFDLPDASERSAIWKIWVDRFAEPGARKTVSIPDDAGWTGAEIKQCCDIAWRLGCTLKEAAAYVVPVSRSAGEQLERLRKAAVGRFLSASYPGVYRGVSADAHAGSSSNGSETRRPKRLAAVEE